MPIPDKPVTRDEFYLDAIATGDTSNLPAEPVTREECYLDYIAKNGGGSGGGALVVHVTATTSGDSTIYTCDKTAGEMYEAMQTGVVVIAPYTEDSAIYGGVCALNIDGGGIYAFVIAGANKSFTADSASGYPSYSKGGK